MQQVWPVETRVYCKSLLVRLLPLSPPLPTPLQVRRFQGRQESIEAELSEHKERLKREAQRHNALVSDLERKHVQVQYLMHLEHGNPAKAGPDG